MEDDKYDPQVGMDLTSQGAGTYWLVGLVAFCTVSLQYTLYTQ